MTTRLTLCVLGLAGATALGQAPTAKAEIVSVAGCLEERAANDWRLVSATEPAPSSANAPQPKDLPALPVVGKNQFKLIGVGVFDLPSYRNHTVLIKALLIKDAPLSRLNVTSVTSVGPKCGKGVSGAG